MLEKVPTKSQLHNFFDDSQFTVSRNMAVSMATCDCHARNIQGVMYGCVQMHNLHRYPDCFTLCNGDYFRKHTIELKCRKLFTHTDYEVKNAEKNVQTEFNVRV